MIGQLGKKKKAKRSLMFFIKTSNNLVRVSVSHIHENYFKILKIQTDHHPYLIVLILQSFL